MPDAIVTEQRDATLIVCFNRPATRSPLSISVLLRLHTIVDDVAGDHALERLIFTGVADVFASGADLREIALVNGDSAAEYARRGQTLMSNITSLPQTTVAAVNGFCFGGALDLALACDSRIASPNALFSHPGAGLGIMTGWGGTQRLPRLVGEAATLEMLMTGRRVNAAEALNIGLIDAIAPEPLGDAIRIKATRTK